MLPNVLATLASVLLAAQAALATGRALLDPTTPCRMILVVENGVITAFDCQDEETECPTLEPGYICAKRKWGTEEEYQYHCNCCEDETEEAACIGAGVDGECLVRIVVPNGQAPILECVDMNRCQGQGCPVDPAPTTGAAVCPCQ